MEVEKVAYRQVLKATGIFGGAQVFVILIGLIKSKFVAVLLGPSGYGINSLLNTPLGLIGVIAGFGISFSAIRDISIANERGDVYQLGKTVSVFNKLLWITGGLGVILTILFSPLLSIWSFEDYSYTWVFIALSLTLLFNTFNSGQLGLLRGIRALLPIAKATVAGPLLTLVLSIPLYYVWGVKGIVPAIFFSAILNLLVSWYYSRKVHIMKVSVSYKGVFRHGKEMIRLGFVMTLASLLSQLVGYFIIIIINILGGHDEVGLYNAGYAITNQYAGLVFTAMAADYFPRLSSVNHDNLKIKSAVNQQGEIMLLLLGPFLILFIILLPFAIRLLFSKEFISIILFVKWMTLGMLFRAISWAVSFISGAKGDSKVFLFTEIVGSIVSFGMFYLGYKYGGLEGLGIAFIFSYIIYFIAVYGVVHQRYNFRFSKDCYSIFFFQVFCLLATILITNYYQGVNGIIIAVILLLVSAIYSCREMQRRLDLLSLLHRIIRKK